MNKNDKTIFTEEMQWEGKSYVSELVNLTEFSGLEPVTQVQAVCFSADSKVVLYKDRDGNYGLPGGTVEVGEVYDQTLRRELREEAAIEPNYYEPLLVVRAYEKSNPEDIDYQLRYWAEVRLLDQPVNDPDGKAVERVVCTESEALDKLGWGRKAEIYFQKAKKKRGRHKKNDDLL